MARGFLCMSLVAVVAMAASATMVAAAPGNLILAATTDTGVKANSDSGDIYLNADGTKVVFVSGATNLDPAGNVGFEDVYVKDLTTGDVRLASTSDTGVTGNSRSSAAGISADGTKVAFASTSTNLDPGDTNGDEDLYVKDLTTGNITLASTSDAGVSANAHVTASSMSPDGTKVVFYSSATNLDPADTDAFTDIYMKDLSTDDITLVTTSDSGEKANDNSNLPDVSGDGTKVTFTSTATNLDPGDADSGPDIYVKDLTTGDITLVSTSDVGVKGNDGSANPVMSADGTKIAFQSVATNLDPGDTDGESDIYLKDVTTGNVTLVSTSDAGVKGDSASSRCSISFDGTKVAFDTFATNFDPRDGGDSAQDIYVKDMTTGDVTLATTSDSGVKGNLDSFAGEISGDGSRAGFVSYSRLDPLDRDRRSDVYVKELGEAPTPPATADLSLTKTDSADPVLAGTTVGYRISVRDLGPQTATGIMLTDQLPDGVTFVSAQPQQGTCTHAGGVVTCDLGALVNGARTNVTIRVIANAPGTLTNTASVSATDNDPNLSNNQDTETTTVQ